MTGKRFFYGWVLLPVAWLIYGFGVAPGYYSWGFFLPQLLEALDLSHTEVGTVFSLFLLCSTVAGPLVGLAISRWGLRWLMTVGLLVSAVGYFLMSQATALVHCVVGYAVLVGFGHSFSLVIPFQTLASNWFTKYRARVTAVIFTAGGVVGRLYLPFDAWILKHYDWRTGWLVIAGISVAVALLAAIFVRTTPEEMGQQPDGIEPGTEAEEPSGKGAAPDPRPAPSWTPAQALRTPQFFLMVVCGLGYAVPWAVINAYSGDHLQSLGFASGVVASLVGTMALVSIVGRLLGAAGDFMAPQKVLGIALAMEALGVGGLLVADTKTLVQVSLVAVGLGFGTAYISIASVFAAFFGRRAFATVTGTRFMIAGVLAALAPVGTGLVFDRFNSYSPAFVALASLSLAGAVIAFFSRAPRHRAQG